MALSSDYLKPQWQKKRLEILERDNFTCIQCGDKENTLHVHHQYYLKDYKVWEYENQSLITLCSRCHEHEHSEEGKEFNREFYSNVLSHNLNTEYVNNFVANMRVTDNPKHARAFVDTLEMCMNRGFFNSLCKAMMEYVESDKTPFKSSPLRRYIEEAEEVE